MHRLVRQHGLADDVADGEDVRYVGAHLDVDVDGAEVGDADSGFLGGNLLSFGRAPHGLQHQVAVFDSARHDALSHHFMLPDVSNLVEQIREALSMFARNGTEPALIGGLAVVAHQVVRGSEGLDLLYAHRPLARCLLAQASERETASDKPAAPMATAQESAGAVAVLAAEAGMPYAPAIGEASGIDPIAEWMSLMEVVQMLRPT